VRSRAAGLAAVVAAAASLFAPSHVPNRADDPRPNIVLLLTDDQSIDTLPAASDPSMPYLQQQWLDPAGHWTTFPNAFLNTSLCCPSRSTILTGRYAFHTRVVNNETGHLLDESQTIATWLHGGGYYTGLIGKYLNHYPFHRGGYVPPGWDIWYAKSNDAESTVYYRFPVYEGPVPLHTSDAPETYVTDLLADHAVRFIESAPSDRPFFLYFSPPAPHGPRIPPPRYDGRFAGVALPPQPAFDEADVSDKPAWVQALPRFTPQQRAILQQQRIDERETLLGIDDAIRRIDEALQARGALNDTVVFFLTDNGYSFGEHRLVGKRCPYEECIRTPFGVRVPWASARSLPMLVSNVDLAPTFADIGGVSPTLPEDGLDLWPDIDPRSRGPTHQPNGVLLEWVGDSVVPAFWGVRTDRYAYVEYADGERELYDLRVDPNELVNRASEPRFAPVVARLSSLLQRLRLG
jgi:N-acetylglucosamine-6-sulfatase